MALGINTNIMALNAQRNLVTSQQGLSTALERLSSGLRINGAKDDAAGLAIAERMTTQIRGLNQAYRNSNDGISIAQVAEAGLADMTSSLQRMRELALQAANGTVSDKDRAAIDAEVQQLYSEINRISSDTVYNGLKLFSGSEAANRNYRIQTGTAAGQNVSFKVGEFDTTTLGLNSSTPKGDVYSGRVDGRTTTNTGTATTGDLRINDVAISFVGTETTAAQFATQINNDSADTGVTAEAYNRLAGETATVSGSNVVHGLTISVGGATAVTVADSASLSDLVDNINAQVGGVTASIGSDGNLVLANDTGASIIIGQIASGPTISGSGLELGTYQGFLSLRSVDGSDITVAAGASVDDSAINKFGLNAGTGSSKLTGVGTVSSTVAFNTATSFGMVSGAVTSTQGGKYDPTTNTRDRFYINDVLVGKASGGDAASMAAAINAVSDQTSVNASAKTQAYLNLNFNGISTSLGGSVSSLVINGTVVQLASASVRDLDDVVTVINAANPSGVIASADDETGRLVLTSETGADIAIGQINTSAAANGSFITGVSENRGYSNAVSLSTDQGVAVRGRITLEGEDGNSIKIDGNTTLISGGLAQFGFAAQATDSDVAAGGLNVLTEKSALNALTALDAAIETITIKRTDLGAVQNRLSLLMNTLQLQAEKQTEARSRIMDADFAAETAALTRAQIMQQAGVSVLAQANQSQQNVLSLLK